MGKGNNMQDYLIVGLETYSKESCKSYKRQVKYHKDWMGNIELAYFECNTKMYANIKIDKVYLLDLKCFSIIEMGIDEYIELNGGLGDTLVFEESKAGYYSLTYKGSELPFIYKGKVVLSDSLTSKFNRERLKYFNHLNLFYLSLKNKDGDEIDRINIFINLLSGSVALAKGLFIIQNLNGEIDDDVLMNVEDMPKYFYDLNISNYIGLVDCRSHLEIYNTAIFYNVETAYSDFNIDNIVLRNNIETILFYFLEQSSEDCGHNRNIVVPPSVKRICISYTEDEDTYMHSTFIINSNKIKEIEFVFIENGDGYCIYNHDTLKTDDICTIDKRLNDKGISLRLYG